MVPYVVIGRGSNLVVSDAGIRGLVIVSRAEGCRIEGDRLVAEAGVPLARAATIAQRAGLSGLEFGLAIPGTVGGAVWANAGAHGSDVAAVLETARILRADGTEAEEPAAGLNLAYRDSRFKHPAGQGSAASASAASPEAADVILEATFRLAHADPATIKTRLDEIRRWRREHQPLTLPSAGVGGAAISDKHANFIVNEGRASAADVRSVAETARAEVARRFGVQLVYEVLFLGDWSGLGQEAR
jgi:UDP-N-acetylmuramate dehydrogenase